MTAVTVEGDQVVVRPYTHRTGWISSAEKSGTARVSVNAATGVVDLYEGDQVPVTIEARNFIRGSADSVRWDNRQYIAFYDVSHKRWTEPRQVYASAWQASRVVAGETRLEALHAVVSADGRALHLLGGYRTHVSLPERPTVPITSVSRLSPTHPLYVDAVRVRLSRSDAARRDFQMPLGWRLDFQIDSGGVQVPARIMDRGRGSLVLYTGPNAAFIAAQARDVTLTFTGEDQGSNALWEWERLMQTAEVGLRVRTLRGDELGRAVKLPGFRTGNGVLSAEVHSTALVDGFPVVLTEELDSQYRKSVRAYTRINGAWKNPRVVVSHWDSDAYDYPVRFMPHGERTALITAEGAADGPGVPGLASGVLRRVFTAGQWGQPEFIRALTAGEGQTVPVVVRLAGAGGPVEVEVIRRNPGVVVVGSTYDPQERLNGAAVGTVTYSYRGTAPRSPAGYVTVDGWSGLGTGSSWALGSNSAVVDERARTVKMSAYTPPSGSAPTSPARITWTELWETVYAVDRRG